MEQDIIKDILTGSRRIAVVGLSDNPERPSYRVASYLRDHGYEIIPVNPEVRWVLGHLSYPDVASIPESIDVVQIFRRPEEVMPIVEQAIKKGARAIWMQEGVINDEAAEKARKAGLKVVMDRCMLKEHTRLSVAESG